ncbi:MAG: porin [Thermoanaerobaculales bacterium]|nr:porin [Thermoanaerobaculales bacterium]
MRGIGGCLAAVLAVLVLLVVPVVADEAAEEKHENLLTTRYDKGFRFATANGAYSLRLNGLIQGRYTYVDYDPEVRYNQDSYSNFFVRRARLYFSGNAGSPRFRYLFHIQLEPSQGINANDMWLEYEFSDWFQLGAGRNKISYGLEMLNSGSALGLVERSLMYGETDIDLGESAYPGPRFPGGGTARFGLSTYADTGFATGGMNLYRALGIQVQGKKGSAERPTFEYQVGVWQGRGTGSSSNSGDDHLTSVRVGYHPWGFIDWKVVGDLHHNESFKLGLIGSVYRNRGEQPHEFDEHGFNMAVLVRWRGWSADIEWGTERYDFADVADDFERVGWRAAFGWFVVPSRWEVRARYAEIQRLKNPTYRAALASGLGVPEVWDGEDWTPALEAKISEITVGVSRRLPGFRNLVVLDASRLVREFAADSEAVIDGEPAPIAKAPDQVDYRIRMMVQLVF